MRKFRFAIIDIVLIVLMTISSYADSDVELLHDEQTLDAGSNDDENTTIVGDMLLTNDQLNYLYSTDSESQRLALGNPFLRWPNANVYYKIDNSLDEKVREMVEEAMSTIQDVSCVRFIDVKDEKTKHYVLIKKGNACSSKIGMRRSGPQQMIIDGNLCTKGSVIHELLHCLGFLHMHTANERDEYININWNNIRDDAKLNFKQFVAHVSMFSTEYDYDSITHYSSIAFAKNKSIPTIIAKKSAPNMGQRKELSVGDIARINRMYECLESGISLVQSNVKSDEFSDGVNKTNTLTNNLTTETNQNEMKISELNLNDTLTGDDVAEDDMILKQEQIDALYSLNAAKRNGLKNVFHHWPMGIVPFEIDPSFPPEFVSSIYDSMNYISNRSCVRFVRKTPYNHDYIYITRGPGCSSEVGMQKIGRQTMNINEKLCPRGKIIHELLHSLGFFHMHTANERDNYVQINWENIKEKAKFNFKQFVSHVTMFSTPYDYDSIMHYSPMAFAIDRKIPTILALQPAPNMGQRAGMSVGDVTRLNRMYKCAPVNSQQMPNFSSFPPTTNTNANSLVENVPVEKSSPEAGVGSSSNSKELSTDKKNNPESIFGMLIFKTFRNN